MITKNDIVVKSRQKNHTHLSNWESYCFVVKNQPKLFIRIINKETRINDKFPKFRFWAKICDTLDEAKQYIADYINENGNASGI